MARRKSETQKIAEDVVKKTHGLTIFLSIIFLLIGAVLGYIVTKTLTKNDKFLLNNEKEIFLEVGDDYIEYSATAISFGRDVSDKIKIGGDTVNTSKAGVYQVVYEIDDFWLGDCRLVRTVTVGEVE